VRAGIVRKGLGLWSLLTVSLSHIDQGELWCWKGPVG